MDEAVALAADQAYAVAGAAVEQAFLHQYRDEPVAVRHWAEAAVAVAAEHGYPFRLVQARIMRGWAWARCGRGDEGVAELRAGLEAYESTGAFVEWPHYLGMLADALLRMGRPGEVLDQLSAAFAALEPGRSYFYEPELHRLRAESLLAAGGGRSDYETRAALQRGLQLADALGSPPVRLRVLLASLEAGPDDRDRHDLHGAIRETLAGVDNDDRAPDLLRARQYVGPGQP